MNLATLTIYLVILFVGTALPLSAGSEKMGMHLLHPNEIDQIDKYLPDSDEARYITIPITTDQLDHELWQSFFDQARDKNIIPLVRLATNYDATTDAWRQPDRADIIKFAQFFSSLEWSQTTRYLILFNETNHAKEWGGEIKPDEYARMLVFTSRWFKTEPFEYRILPAGLDAAAPNGPDTMDSFSFLKKMTEAEPDWLTHIDYWNSHAYPNPGFVSSAYRSGKNAIDGWKYELDYLTTFSDRELQVFITETGWDQRYKTQWQLTDYYRYALEHVWSDQRVKAVTPFIFQGNNGVFDHFSFVSADGHPTRQMQALLAALNKVSPNL